MRRFEQLLIMAPDAFEWLAQRLLREAHLDNVTVTGKSGDSGIDGLGVYRLGWSASRSSSSGSVTASASALAPSVTSAARCQAAVTRAC